MGGRYSVQRFFIGLFKALSILSLVVGLARFCSLAVIVLPLPWLVPQNPSINSMSPVGRIPDMPRTGFSDIDSMTSAISGLFDMQLPVREGLTYISAIALYLAVAQIVGSVIFSIAMWAAAHYWQAKLDNEENTRQTADQLQRQRWQPPINRWWDKSSQLQLPPPPGPTNVQKYIEREQATPPRPRSANKYFNRNSTPRQ